jgi:hypothetical protein
LRRHEAPLGFQRPPSRLPLAVWEHQQQGLLQQAGYVAYGAQPSVLSLAEERV